MAAVDSTPRELVKLVLDKITELGDKQAQEYFEVSAGTISAWKTLKTFPSIVAAQKVWDENLTCQAPEIWGDAQRAHVQILLPAMDSIEVLTFVTLFRACKLYGMDKINIIPKWRTLIVEARNDLAERALITKSEWFVFVDADGVFPCGSASLLAKHGLHLPEKKAARNAIERIMSHPADKLIVGALYKDRRGGTRAQCEGGFRNPQENARLMSMFDPAKGSESDGLEKQGWIGFGMVRIHRSVFERMKEAAKPGGPLEEIAPPKGRESDPHGFFDTNRQARGEDIKFCRRAGQIGIDVWLDTGLTLGHIGSKIY
jgi:hypothetical protein